MTTHIDDIHDFDDHDEHTEAMLYRARQENARRASDQRDIRLFCITPQVNRRHDPEPAQVRESSWED